ncbi:MAG: hypothetical protein ACTSPV_14940 [Candidatus Hodarchaeales archaeon]
MRFLHIGDKLPDVRIERFIQLDSLLKHSSAFAGIIDTPLSTHLNLPDNIRSFHLSIDRSFRLGLIRDQIFDEFGVILDTYDPDLIHVHNIYFLNFLLKFFKRNHKDLPWVYNDHEFWSESMYLRFRGHMSSLRLFKASRAYYKHLLFKKWEKKYVFSKVVMTVSQEIMKAHQHRFQAKFATFIPNMPTLAELASINTLDRNTDKTAIYIGSDFTRKTVPSRFTGNILAQWKQARPAQLNVVGDPSITSSDIITSIGIVPHFDLYRYSSQAHFGLLAYLPHPFHKFISPNKIYIYIHAGALPILPKDVPFEVDVPRFSNTTELFEIIRKQTVPSKEDLQKMARDYLIADRFIDRLKQAYEQAVSL